MPSVTSRDRFLVANITLGYLIVAWGTLALRIQPEGLTPVWLAAGIFLPVLLLSRQSLRPWLVGALFLADLTARAMFGGPMLIMVASSLAAAGSAALSVWMLHRYVGEPVTLERMRETAAWLAISVLFSNGVASLLIAGASVSVGVSQSFWTAWIWSFAPRGMGDLVMTPLIMSWVIWYRARPAERVPSRIFELAVLCTLALVVRVFVLSGLSEHRLLALLLPGAALPFLMWAALRFGLRGVSTVLAELAAIIMVFIAAASRIPGLSFNPQAPNDVLVLHLTLATLAIPILLLTAAMAEHTQAQASLGRANRALHLISECNLALLRATDEVTLLKNICDLAVGIGGYRMAWVGFAVDDEEKNVQPVAQAGFEQGYLDTAAITWADSERGLGPTGRAIRGKRPMVANALDTDPTFGPWRNESQRLNFASSLALPLMIGERVFGALMLYSARSNAFDAEEVALLTELANNIAFGVSGLRAGVAHERDREAVHAMDVRYRRLFESAKDGILILDAETGKIVDVNPFLTGLLGYSRDEVLDRHLWDLGFLADIIASREAFGELREKGYIRYNDRALMTRSGERVDVEFISNVYLVEGNRVIQCNIRDMTESRNAQAALMASQQLTREIIDALPVRVFWKDRNLRYLGCNVAFAKDSGLAHPQDIIGLDDSQMVWSAQAALYQADDREVLETGQPKLLIEELQTTSAGKTNAVLTSKVALRDADGNVSGIIGTYLDITDRRRAERSEALLAMAVQQAAETIMITDSQGIIVDVNPAFEVTSGYSRAEAIGQNPRMLKSGEQDDSFYREMWAVLSSGEVWRGRLTNRRKDGTLFVEEVTISPMRDDTGKPVNFIAVKRDVTEQEQLGAQLRRTQRLESIGTLAGGIAHDLNNALAPVLMAAELIRLDAPEFLRPDLDVIEAGARRGASLVKQLLTFARGAPGDRLPVQIQPVLNEVEKMIRSTFPKNIELRVDFPEHIPAILGDATQLHQVVLNLLLNARDAMPDGGDLLLEARTTDVDVSPETEAFKVNPGKFVVLRVTDSGEGMTPAVLERIFDPFFTTKSPDKGTGLGLATTLGIVKGHGGFIRVYSIPGKGTTVRVFLPVHTQTRREQMLQIENAAPFRGNGELILVVDDDSAVRDVLRRVLTRLQFTVVTASNGTSALQEVSTHKATLSAVITDLHMPELDGVRFLRLLRGQLPDVGVIVVSGLVGEPERIEFANLGVLAVIDKPFAHGELVGALQTVFKS